MSLKSPSSITGAVHPNNHRFRLFISTSHHLPVFNRFVEYGRFGGHYYGTSVDSVRKVMAEGKVCLLDVHPSVSERTTRSGAFTVVLPSAASRGRGGQERLERKSQKKDG